MRTKIAVILILVCMAGALAQQCPQWNSTTYYQPGDKVVYNGKAWQALVLIWYWPPPHPIYWKEISMSYCSGGSCILKLKLHSQGSITVDSLPNGTRGELDSTGTGRVDLTYPYGKTVRLTANPHTGYKFCYWKNNAGNPAGRIFEIKLVRDSTIEPIFATLGLCTLIIRLSDSGSVAIDTLPNGSIGVFSKSDADSVVFIYTENTQLTLTAIPAEGYTFKNWGDAGQTAVKSTALTMNMRYRFAPRFQAGTTVYKVPSQTDYATNMRVDGRTRLYGTATMYDGCTVHGTVLLKDRSGYGSVGDITANDITFGQTMITRSDAYTESMRCDLLTADKLYYSDTLNTGNCITKRVRVTADAFPDFVFYKGYTLKSIDEVEKFYRLNKHLENIPTAAEIKENKADLGDLYVKMLRKVEENMLYVIELQKRVEALKDKNQKPPSK